jgi:RHS repeat-associated protein
VTRYQHGDASGNKFNQKTDFSYNVKGWLRTINTPANLGRDLFALDLRYNDLQNGTALGGTARYNGNISQMLWDTGTPSGYAFRYDSLNRIKSAKYAEGSGYNSNVNLFNTSYTYDKNGNFITHNRFLNGIRVDSLYYTYQSSGNRLQSVTDRSLNYQGYNAVSGNYAYDSNGNMTYDVSKGFTITYNQLNLPQQISCVNDYALYTWDAVGNKLAKKVYGNTAATTRYDYSGNFLYENSVLKCIFTSEGRIVPFNNNGSVLWNYEYNLKDHLGNTRIVFTAHSDGKPETNQITSYDPFGFVTKQDNWYATSTLKNKYLYNGKEIQNDVLAGTSLNWYDYGARFLDSELGMWHTVDPLAELGRRWSPCSYGFDNPMRFVDSDGMWPILGGPALNNGMRKFLMSIAPYTDLNDVVVLGSSLLSPITGKDPINIDGTTASPEDVEAAKMGILLPAMSGSGAKRLMGEAEEVINDASKGIRANQKAGALREAAEKTDLEKAFPGASVQGQRYLRDANGKIVKDPISGEGRRVDFGVIQDGKALDMVETTSKTANKNAQILKEQRIRQEGGTFIKNKNTRELIDVGDVPTRINRRN